MLCFSGSVIIPFELVYKISIRRISMFIILVISVELEKQAVCDLKVANTTDQHVAFKVVTSLSNILYSLILVAVSFDIVRLARSSSHYLHSFSVSFFLRSGQDNFSEKILCATQHWCYTTLGFMCHTRCMLNLPVFYVTFMCQIIFCVIFLALCFLPSCHFS